MFHVELRQPPHSVRRLNLSEDELSERLIDPWSQDRQAVVGERSWDRRAAEITIIQGPEIEVGRLTMGRGWAIACREGEDVTETVRATIEQRRSEAAARGVVFGGLPAAPAGNLAAEMPLMPADAAASAGQPPGRPPGSPMLPAQDTRADALGLELLRRLGEAPISLIDAWRAAAEREPTCDAAQSLALAAGAVASLARANLASIVRRAPGAAAEEGTPVPAAEGTLVPAAELDGVLRSVDSWSGEHADGETLWLRRT